MEVTSKIIYIPEVKDRCERYRRGRTVMSELISITVTTLCMQNMRACIICLKTLLSFFLIFVFLYILPVHKFTVFPRRLYYE